MPVKQRSFWISISFAVLTIATVISAIYAVNYFEPTKYEATQDAQNETEIVAVNILASERVAYYTEILAIFTGLLSGLGLLQIFFLIRADKTARLAAEASVNVHLPVIAPHYVHLAGVDGGGKHIGPLGAGQLPFNRLRVIIQVRNIGQSVAEIIEGCIEMMITAELPPEPSYKNIFPYAPNVLLQPTNGVGGMVIEPVDNATDITDGQKQELLAKRQFIWVYGYLAFRDFMGDRHAYRFGFKWAIFAERPNGPQGFVYDDAVPPKYTKRD